MSPLGFYAFRLLSDDGWKLIRDKATTSARERVVSFQPPRKIIQIT